MSGKRVAGHERRAIPLSPVPAPRRSPSAGWRMECLCKWTAGPFARRIDAEAAYSGHLLEAYPRCSKCGELVPRYRVSKFRSSLCKSCSYKAARAWKAENPKAWERSARRSHLKKQYGITPEDFDRLLQSQGGKCAICHETNLRDVRGFRPHVDHSHKTGRVRGILCGRCNKGLGALKDDVEIVRRALSYLERSAG
jgi:hypothetical protein